MPRPTAITLDRKRNVLLIPWDEGHTSEYPLSLLREACPCVECRGGHENMGTAPNVDDLLIIPLAPMKSYVITRILPVGNYAIQPEWDDGHHTGIYTWAYLRALCPCEECRAQRG
ncbi:MAG: gamma-butyrobetaine hydroxylase-like domain-containing protein [Anaerolineales bacterium]